MDKSDNGDTPERSKSKKKSDAVIFQEQPNQPNNQDWPYNQIIPLSSDEPCPVVYDTCVQRSYSPASMRVPKLTKGASQLTESLPQPLAARPSLPNAINVNASNNDLKSNSIFHDNEVDSADEGTPVSGGGGGREALAMLLMKDREAEYTQLHNYSVFCGSWNVNGQPVMARLKNWLSPMEDLDPPDIYAIGLQEMDLSKNVYIFTESAKEDEWLLNIKTALHSGGNYKLLHRIRLVAIMLVVFVNQSVEKHIRDLQCESVGTGLFGMMGNKGGVAVRFKLRETNVCIVNSHLAAHTEELERRNQDFRDINSKLYFRGPRRNVSIAEHDVVFWIGDLNYRISDIDTDEVKSLASKRAFQDLLNFDQLSRQMILKNVFPDYIEGAISFQPTFKYEPGTDDWASSEKARTPAWCDRILWKGQNTKQLTYRSHPQLKLSDHKPVSSIFTMGTKVFDRVLERQVRENVMKLLDQKENEFLPQISLSTLEVHFDKLKYLDNQQRNITLVNVGQVPVRFSFSNKPSDSSPFKPWLSIQPVDGFILVGQKVDLLLEVQINSKTINDWDTYKIEDIVVLHLEGGKDFFITLSANCLPSFFGLPLSKLVQMHDPVAINNKPDLKSAPLGVPKELWFIIDYLFKYAMQQEELFQILGLEKEIKVIRDKLDSTLAGLTASQLTVHSVAETLLIFLDALPDPVIPYRFYEQCLNCTDVASKLEVIDKLPCSHSNVFKYLCAFLREHLSHSDQNKSDLRILSHLFSGVLLKNPETHSLPLSNQRLAEESSKRASFLQHFLSNVFE